MTRDEVTSAIRQLIVERLHLKVEPQSIGADEPLFGEGLGLDSVEALEIVVALEERFGITVEDTENVKSSFYSVNTLTDYVLDLMGQTGESSIARAGD